MPEIFFGTRVSSRPEEGVGRMENLFHPKDREALARRLGQLEVDTPRRWGHMSAVAMLGHCAEGFRVAMGEGPQRQNWKGRLFAGLLRRRVLGPKPFAKGVPTDPCFQPVPSADFQAERLRLATLLDRFVQRGPEGAAMAVHPFFGRLSGLDWGRLMAKHLDHHLRQFGL